MERGLADMRYRKNEALQGALYILPSFILIIVFSLLPIVMNLYVSFTKYNVMQPPKWIGLLNYVRLVKDPFVRASLINSALFTAIIVPIQTILSLIIAAIIAEKYRGRFGRFVKSSMFVPVIASTVLVGTLWSMMLSPNGPVNMLLASIGLGKIGWLGGRFTALISVCMASIWKNVGYFLVIYYAGIMDIPVSLYEAAQVDGANAMQRFFRITVPCLNPTTYLIVTLGTIWTFQIFDMVYMMTGGGPGTSTVSMVLTIYNAALKERSMGYASAVALVMMVFILLISFVQKQMLQRERRDEHA